MTRLSDKRFWTHSLTLSARTCEQASQNDEGLVIRNQVRTQPCPECGTSIGDMPGSRDAHCASCGFKDPCCGD